MGMKRENAWKTYGKKDLKKIEELCDGYKDYLFNGKTEREGTAYIIKEAKKAGYISLEEALERNGKLKPGDKIYANNMGKMIALFQIGEEPLEKGMNIVGAHLDSPRLDVKQNPLYEKQDLAYLDTHYYGGIKKYQWVTLPLAIHGVVSKTDGTTVNVVIGEEEDDPVFCVTDILIHLAQDQMAKNAAKAVEGENLDLLIASCPIRIDKDKKKDEKKNEKDRDKKEDGAVKKQVLEFLKEKYGIEEEDFMSAELEIVPAGKPRDMGLDRSMILAYGQDDKVCVYTGLAAILKQKELKKTACALLVDKEEIGSVGATGMQSRFFENVVAELICLAGDKNPLTLRRCLANSCMISADVSAGYDPLYASCFEEKNAAFLGRGMVFNKFTGSRGKSGSNDANAEYIDGGVAVLSMHAPWEVTSKADIYETEKGYEAFFQSV